MSREDWYRHTTWTAAEEEAFRSRLRRCRTQGTRAQGLRIQALYLEQAGLATSAMQLLGEYLETCPRDFQLSMVYGQLASCHERLGNVREAVRCLRSALAAEEARPNVRTDAWLEFGRTAVEYGLVDLYEDFLGLVEERGRRTGGLAGEAVFPVQRYLLNACMAIIYASRGEPSRSREHAKSALVAAAERKSGFSRHPEVGLVRDATTDLYQRIAAMGADG